MRTELPTLEPDLWNILLQTDADVDDDHTWEALLTLGDLLGQSPSGWLPILTANTPTAMTGASASTCAMCAPCRRMRLRCTRRAGSPMRRRFAFPLMGENTHHPV